MKIYYYTLWLNRVSKEWSDFGVIMIQLGFGGCFLLAKCVTVSLVADVCDVGKALIRPGFSETFPVVWVLNSSVRVSPRLRFGTKFLWTGGGGPVRKMGNF
jgi:hypothetical protein